MQHVISDQLAEGIRTVATQHEVIHNCIAWNRERMERDLLGRNSSNKDKAIDACRNAQRHANNISRLEEQL